MGYADALVFANRFDSHTKDVLYELLNASIRNRKTSLVHSKTITRALIHLSLVLQQMGVDLDMQKRCVSSRVYRIPSRLLGHTLRLSIGLSQLLSSTCIVVSYRALAWQPPSGVPTSLHIPSLSPWVTRGLTPVLRSGGSNRG